MSRKFAETFAIALIFGQFAFIKAQTCRINVANCGKRVWPRTKDNNVMVTGGDDVQVGEWPWAVGLKHTDGYGICSASLINKRWVMTAGHCASNGDASKVIVITGSNSLNDNSKGSRYTGDKGFKHPDYDISLIKTKENIQMNNDVNGICVPNEKFQEGKNAKGVYAGFGTSEAGTVWVLKQANLTFVASAQYSFNVDLGTKAEVQGGDSGGPAFLNVKGTFYEIGPLTNKYKNNGRNAAYGVRLQNLNKWIEKTLKDNDPTIC